MRNLFLPIVPLLVIACGSSDGTGERFWPQRRLSRCHRLRFGSRPRQRLPVRGCLRPGRGVLGRRRRRAGLQCSLDAELAFACEQFTEGQYEFVYSGTFADDLSEATLDRNVNGNPRCVFSGVPGVS